MQNTHYKNYFLGLLPAAETEEIEHRIISDEDFSGELYAAENELIEEYLDDSLSATEKDAFEKNFLVSDKRRGSLDLINRLRNSATTTFVVNEKPQSFFEQLKAFFTVRRLAVGLATAAILLAAIVPLKIIFDREARPFEREIAALNSKMFTNPEEFKSDTNLNLVSGSFRAGGDVTRIDSNNVGERIFVHLALPNSVKANEELVVRIIRDGRILAEFNQRSYQNPAGCEARIEIPKSVLAKGEFAIEIENQKTSKLDYQFFVN
jgi:hypothetical protein